MNNGGFVLLTGLDHPLETHGMVFGHVGSHDQDCIGVRKILLRGSSAAAPE
jgi:hypothetical protein